ncbi:MAG: HD domain-containing protein, partial [Woeseiaceae bacterium]
MSASEPEISTNGGENAAIVASVDALIDGLPPSPALNAAVREGRDIAAIAASLGLPPNVLAAVRLCPLFRSGIVSDKELQNNKLNDLSRIVLGLEQLSNFTLPADWQPGEALAVQQSEALRKMLLAVVADVRLVLVRIAEQLYRLRCAKAAPRAEQQALGVETREIYAALASRLGVWQLKWELEDLSFRYLNPDAYAEIARALNEK